MHAAENHATLDMHLVFVPGPDSQPQGERRWAMASLGPGVRRNQSASKKTGERIYSSYHLKEYLVVDRRYDYYPARAVCAT
jgi:hypothetical protein